MNESAAKRHDVEAPAKLWQRQLTSTRSANGEVSYPATAKNMAIILQNEPAWSRVIAWDERSERTLFLKAPPFASAAADVFPREVRDSDITRISIWLEGSTYGIRVAPGCDALSKAVDVVAEANRFDPVRDYLEGLAPWDGVLRLPRLCADYFGAADLAINGVFGTKWMISAIARTQVPGCQVDHTLVLVGPQGIRKSSGLRILAGKEFFADSLPDLKGKDAAEYLCGTWIVELAELETFSRSEVQTAKAFMTRRDDRFRFSYARRTTTHARRCVFAATTNEEHFLKDTTGNRRFWPVAVSKVDTDALERDRDQLWAEAKHRYLAGEPWHLTDASMVELAQAAQEARYQADPWEGAIQEYLDGLPLHARRASINDILEGPLKVEIGKHTQREQNRVAGIFQRFGWQRSQVRMPTPAKPNARAWVYLPPGVEP